MFSENDLGILYKNYDNFVVHSPTGPLPPELPLEEQEKIRRIQREIKEASEKDDVKNTWKKKKAKGKYGGLGMKQSAFARALEVRGFNTKDTTKISRGDFTVSFSGDGWLLLKKDKILHTQLFGAGSINIVDQVISRNGGY